MSQRPDIIQLDSLTGACASKPLNAIIDAILRDDQAACNMNTALYKVEKISDLPVLPTQQATLVGVEQGAKQAPGAVAQQGTDRGV